MGLAMLYRLKRQPEEMAEGDPPPEPPARMNGGAHSRRTTRRCAGALASYRASSRDARRVLEVNVTRERVRVVRDADDGGTV